MAWDQCVKTPPEITSNGIVGYKYTLYNTYYNVELWEIVQSFSESLIVWDYIGSGTPTSIIAGQWTKKSERVQRVVIQHKNTYGNLSYKTGFHPTTNWTTPNPTVLVVGKLQQGLNGAGTAYYYRPVGNYWPNVGQYASVGET